MNMDIKDLIAKLKGKAGGGSRTSGGVAAFFEKNPKMKIIIPAIFIVISILVALIIIIKTGSVKVPDIPENVKPDKGTQVEVYPAEVREAEKLEGITDKDVLNKSVLVHPKITAIIYNKEGYYTATVVTDNAHYPSLAVGQSIAGSDWVVDNVTETQVVLSCGEQTVTLNF